MDPVMDDQAGAAEARQRAVARDRSVLLAGAFLRAVGTSLVGVELGLLLATRGVTPTAAGAIVAAGLAGATLAALATTFGADAFGRRRTLAAVAALGAAGTLAACAAASPGLLALAAFAGMLNGMGRDRGAALIVEQAALPALGGEKERTRLFAWYNVLQDSGHALGSLLAALPGPLARSFGLAAPRAHAATLSLNAALLLGCAALALVLSPAVETSGRRAASWGDLSPRARGFVARVTGLFALDSLGSGFLTTSLLSWFFFRRFGAGSATIAGLFAAARVLNALSHLGAAWLARRIGLVNTMVLTHLPSSLLLATVAIAPTFPVAAALFLLREALVEMDVPTRQSYVMAIVAPEERTLASGITNLVRMAGWALTPLLAGRLMQGLSLGAPLVIGGAAKIAYDLLLWRAFRAVKPPEERRAT